jgi:hypothetical protein
VAVTEQEYITVSALARVRAAQDVLRDLAYLEIGAVKTAYSELTRYRLELEREVESYTDGDQP